MDEITRGEKYIPFLRTFAPIVSAHPYCAQLHAQIHVMHFGRSVTPTFLFRNRFYLQLSPHCSKMNENQCGKLKKFQDFCRGDMESCHLAAARRVKLWSLRPGSDAVLHMSRIECKWGKTKDFSHLHSIRLMWSMASELGLNANRFFEEPHQLTKFA